MRRCDEIDWAGWTSLDGEQKSQLAMQLRREVGIAHQLYDVVDKLQVLARDGGSDDVLACDPADPVNAYLVHLVWSDGPVDDASFPWTCSITKTLVPDRFL